MKMRHLLLAMLLGALIPLPAVAVPETVGVRVTDVTTSSFCLVWMTDVAAQPGVEVYGDSAMANRLNDNLLITPMPKAPADVADAARGKGIMKVRVTGLAPNTKYYVRAVTVDPADPLSVGYSGLQEVTTAAAVSVYKPLSDGTLQGFANDLLAMRVYIRPGDTAALLGKGNLLILETAGAPYPVSAFVGTGTTAPEGVVDLNNLFDVDKLSLGLQGGEKALLTIYRDGSGALSTLLHYRKFPTNGNAVAVAEPVVGFFADINLDGKVDDQDFAEFRKQYQDAKAVPNTKGSYNPDFNFDHDLSDRVDISDFARFAPQYGKAVVQ